VITAAPRTYSATPWTYEGTSPKLGIVIVAAEPARGDSLTHTIATTDDPAVLADMTSSEWVGRRVEVDGARISG